MELSEARPVPLATLAALYLTLRRAHPTVPARRVVSFLLSDTDLTFEQFVCRHNFSDGERAICGHCGLDGDG